MKKILSYILLFTLSVSYSQEITGAYGYNLGDKIDEKKSIGISKKPFRKFKNYSIIFTPETKKISTILIWTKYQYPIQGEEETIIIKNVLEKKYKNEFKKIETNHSKRNQIDIYRLTKGTREIQIEKRNKKREIMLIYTDKTLQKQRNQELKEAHEKRIREGLNSENIDLL